MCVTSLGWRYLVNAYGVKAGWFVPFVDKRVGGRRNCVIPLTRAIPERIRGGLRRCAIQIDVYFTYFNLTK